MKILICVALVVTFILWACVKVGSDYDDEMEEMNPVEKVEESSGD